MKGQIKAVAPWIGTLAVMLLVTNGCTDSGSASDDSATLHDVHDIDVEIGGSMPLSEHSDYIGRILCLDEVAHVQIEKSDTDGHRAIESASIIELPEQYRPICPLD
jgi:altronate dehydratase